METNTPKFKIRLGLFIVIGVALFLITLFIIGKQKNLFDPVFTLTTNFYNVSGLEVGSNIRFSGITVGTVDNINIINDSTVKVDLLIKKSVQQFIKEDCEAAIGSAGIIGDRILILTQGSTDAPIARNGQHITSKEPVETDAIMASLQITANNAEIISDQLAQIMININEGKGTLGRLIQDSTIAGNIDQTIVNLKNSTKGLNENMNAAKENFLLKGYFNRKEREAEKEKKEALKAEEKEQKANDQMWLKCILIFSIVSILINDFTFAQQPLVQKDSISIYSKIETYSGRSKFTKFMYKLVFKPTTPASYKRRTYKKLIQKPYSSFEGKTIRHIQVETLDPFGYSINDTTAVARNFLLKTGNVLHVKSQAITILNLLLIRLNQQFDALRVKESERLVRSMNFVRDVSFFVKETARNSDSVDVFIRVLDSWSIIPKFSTSTTDTKVRLTDENFVGLGHEFQTIYSQKHIAGTNAFSINYSIPNFRNTYIRTTFHYGVDGLKNFNRSLYFERPFFSPLARWAAGINIGQQFSNDSIAIDNLQPLPQRFKFNIQDFWAGNAIQLFKGNSEYRRTTNFISSARFLRVRYLEKPTEALDPQQFYTNENFYLASVGVSTRKYVQDKFIFKFGITEDVPIGKVFSITGGIQDKNSTNRIYLGARISFGKYYTWGYLGSNFEYGSFYKASHTEQGVAEAGMNYFTGLYEIGKWKFRQFMKPQITIGINRFAFDSLTINDGFGLDGFHSASLFGTSRLLLAFQTQSYAPWNFIGFRFGPYFIYSIGMLGNSVTGFRNSKLYSQIGFGVLIRNENLVLNTFQISIAFYPIIPDKGQNIFKLNSFKTTDFGLRDFEIGKPATVVFR
jgi:hypothetical protein